MLIRLNLLFVQKQVTVERSNSVKVAETIISVFFGKGLTGFDSASLSKKKNACRRPFDGCTPEERQLLVNLIIEQGKFREQMENQKNEINELKASINQFRSLSTNIEDEVEVVLSGLNQMRYHLRAINSDGVSQMHQHQKP